MTNYRDQFITTDIMEAADVNDLNRKIDELHKRKLPPPAAICFEWSESVGYTYRVGYTNVPIVEHWSLPADKDLDDREIQEYIEYA